MNPALKEWLSQRTGPWSLVECFDWWERGTMIAIPPLRDAIRDAKISIEYLPINSLLVRQLIDRNTVAPDHVMELSQKREMVPVIFAIDERGRQMLIDGNHRYVLMGLRGMKRVPCFVVYPALWTQFEIKRGSR